MRLQLQFVTILLFITQVFAYLSERSAPFTITLNNVDSQQQQLEFKRGDTIEITWGLSPGVRFPLYGYASARSAKTDVGLLAPESTRTEPYLYNINNDVSVLDYSYTWTIPNDVPSGKYQIGVGFFYHEVSPEIRIVE